MSPILFRKLQADQQPAPGELWIRPLRPEDRDQRATARLVLESGLAALECGTGAVERIVVDASGTQPTFDEMLAAWFAQRLLDQQPMPESLRNLAEYARLMRQGLTPTNLPPEETIEGIYQAIRNLSGIDLTQAGIAQSFLARWQRLADRLLRSAKANRNFFRRSLFAGDESFAEEMAYLRRDENVYCQDVARGERWTVHLPGGPPVSSALFLRQPKSLLFAFWSRRDRRTPTGEPYLFLAVDWGKGEWVFSTDPVGQLSLQGLAEQLQEAELSRCPEAASNPWYDGRNHRYTLAAAPRGGSKLRERDVLRLVSTWAGRTRPMPRRIAVAGLCIALLAGLSGFFFPANPVRGLDFEEDLTISDPNSPFPSGQRQGRDYALLFAADHYKNWGNLNNPVRDMKAIKTILESKYGFELECVEDADGDTVLGKIRTYYKKKFEPDDQLLILFAGHGFYDKVFEEGYLVTFESRAPSDKDAEGRKSYLAHSQLRKHINKIPCNHILVIMDVCHGGTFDERVAMRGSSYREVSKREFIRRKMRWKTRRYLTSGGNTYVSDGPPGKHSPFAAKLMATLEHGSEDGILTFSRLSIAVEKMKPEPCAGHFGDSDQNSDFLFIEKK